ncbi:Clathrin light chain [Microbotryomycetes sp. JL201]|nr:Clathrin light chain [Microbotryomycetes sp. JL201]
MSFQIPNVSLAFPTRTMDDLFGSPQAGQGSDATADFLARERAALGEDFGAAPNAGASFDKDFEKGAAAFPALDGDEDDGGFEAFTAGGASSTNTHVLDHGPELVTAAPPAIASVAKGPYEGGMGAQQQHVSVTGHDDLGAFEQEYPAIDIPETQSVQQVRLNAITGLASKPPGPPLRFIQALAALLTKPSDTDYWLDSTQTNGFQAAQSNYSQPMGAFSGIPQSQEEESEFIKNWKVKQAEEIARREEESASKKEETIVKAQNAIDNFYKEYNAQKEKAIAQNKEEEALFNEKRTEELAKGTTWERICNMIELQDSRSKTTTRSKQDLSRFKEILLSLKREGETAPGAAGY